jgi:hypothetical protein
MEEEKKKKEQEDFGAWVDQAERFINGQSPVKGYIDFLAIVDLVRKEKPENIINIMEKGPEESKKFYREFGKIVRDNKTHKEILDKIIKTEQDILNDMEALKKRGLAKYTNDHISSYDDLYFLNKYITMAGFMAHKNTFEGEITTAEIKESLHKQPRGLLKTSARITGRDQGGDIETIFNIKRRDLFKDEVMFKEVLNKNTSILAMHIIKLWQENGKKPLTIKNLSKLSRLMNTTNHEVKLYLIRLGGSVYPLQYKNENGGLSISNTLLFKVVFNYGPEVLKKFEKNGSDIIRFGGNKFLKDEPTESIVIYVDLSLQEELQGKGLGNVMVTDRYLSEALKLSDIAFKIYTYTASNQPRYKIGEMKLIRDLGLEEQRKKQGLPRIKKQIEKGFKELKDNGHIKKYNYNEEKKIYEFEYSNKYVKHSKYK